MKKVWKRYNLALPPELYDTIEAISNEQHTTVLEVIKRFLRLGLVAHAIAKNPDAKLIIREHGQDREIVLL